MIRKGLSDKVTFDERPERTGGESQADLLGKGSHARMMQDPRKGPKMSVCIVLMAKQEGHCGVNGASKGENSEGREQEE